jgi:uncharacterized protein
MEKNIPIEAIEHIFENTELNPFYMNILCQNVWRENQMPLVEKIDAIWHDYVKTQRNIISHDVMELSANQRKIIIALSKYPTNEIQSTEFTVPLKISSSSAQQSIEVLIRKDLIYQTDDGFYRILDPAMKYYINAILWES